jgi:hypothetical protein
LGQFRHAHIERQSLRPPRGVDNRRRRIGRRDTPDIHSKHDKGSVLNSYATGSVSGGGASQVGGLIGNVNDGIVAASYGAGAVAGHAQSYLIANPPPK